ncbi:hypothetical protein BJ742DRAFT_415110 [Cladochytrium replicatum]|nr:hypothetical protein BJ742DRAFT_415110 [Cladochytrium replicatum]
MLALAIAIIFVVSYYHTPCRSLTSHPSSSTCNSSIASTVLESVAIDTLGVAAYFWDLFRCVPDRVGHRSRVFGICTAPCHFQVQQTEHSLIRNDELPAAQSSTGVRCT